MGKKNHGKHALVDSLRFPQDACLGETMLTFIGRTAVQIENYRSILIYSDTNIKIQAKRYKLTVSGRNLKIRYYDKDEMEIVGQISSINFE